MDELNQNMRPLAAQPFQAVDAYANPESKRSRRLCCTAFCHKAAVITILVVGVFWVVGCPLWCHLEKLDGQRKLALARENRDALKVPEDDWKNSVEWRSFNEEARQQKLAINLAEFCFSCQAVIGVGFLLLAVFVACCTCCVDDLDGPDEYDEDDGNTVIGIVGVPTGYAAPVMPTQFATMQDFNPEVPVMGAPMMGGGPMGEPPMMGGAPIGASPMMGAPQSGDTPSPTMGRVGDGLCAVDAMMVM